MSDGAIATGLGRGVREAVGFRQRKHNGTTLLLRCGHPGSTPLTTLNARLIERTQPGASAIRT